jgi:N-acetylmuramoyl-L-alanine amidase
MAQSIYAIQQNVMTRVGIALIALCLLLAQQPLQAQKAKITIRMATLDNIQYLYLEDVAKFYGFTYRISGKDAILSSRYSRLVFTKDKHVANINATNQHLGYAIRIFNGHFLIGRVDFSKTLDPILRPATLPRRNVRKIIIDAGHGGKDPGCQSGGQSEKTINLGVAQKLAGYLKNRGYTVYMMRNSDMTLTLKQRVDAANKTKPDLFISLHCNAADVASASGIEVYCATPVNMPPSDSKTVSKKACIANAYDLENAYLAYYIQKRLVSTLKTTDRGARRKRYTVIADTNAPSILVEMGFLTNPNDRKLLTSQVRQSIIARAIAVAVDQYKESVAFPNPRLVK